MDRKDAIDRLYEMEEKIPRKLPLDKYDDNCFLYIIFYYIIFWWR